MVALLKNVTASYSRSIYNATTGNTAAPTPYGTLQARAFSKHQMDFKLLPNAALDSDIVLRCDENADVQEGDVWTSIIVNRSGLNWPGTTPNANEILQTVFVDESASGFDIEYRDAYVRRARVGGPTSA